MHAVLMGAVVSCCHTAIWLISDAFSKDYNDSIPTWLVRVILLPAKHKRHKSLSGLRVLMPND